MEDQTAGDELDLRALVRAIWHGRWIVLGSTFVCSVLAVVYALLLTPIYRAEAVVQVRNDTKSGGGLAAVAAQLGGFADLSSLLGGTESDRALTLATLKSRILIQAFLQEHALLPVLFEDLWDPETKRWTVDDPKEEPTLWLGHEIFVEDVLRVSEDRKTGLVMIAVEWHDAEQAAAWTTELIARTNAYLRERTIQESERNLAYLQQQLKQTGLVELQQAVYTLVESELKKLMLAKGSEEYAIKTIDPAQPPKRRYKPNRALIAVSGFMLGGFIGLLILFVRSELQPRPAA